MRRYALCGGIPRHCIELLNAYQREYKVVSGTGDARFSCAIQHIEDFKA